MKIKAELTNDGKVIGYSFFCPGCGHAHVFYTNPETSKIVWGFNGNLDKPTFSPSLLNRTGSFAEPTFKDPEGVPPTRCHLYVTDGIINYCTDSTHSLAGRTVELPDF